MAQVTKPINVKIYAIASYMSYFKSCHSIKELHENSFGKVTSRRQLISEVLVAHGLAHARLQCCF